MWAQPYVWGLLWCEVVSGWAIRNVIIDNKGCAACTQDFLLCLVTSLCQSTLNTGQKSCVSLVEWVLFLHVAGVAWFGAGSDPSPNILTILKLPSPAASWASVPTCWKYKPKMFLFCCCTRDNLGVGLNMSGCCQPWRKGVVPLALLLSDFGLVCPRRSMAGADTISQKSLPLSRKIHWVKTSLLNPCNQAAWSELV